MISKIYWIHRFDDTASLGIMARPRGGDWLEGEIINLKKKKVGVLVSLLEKHEIFELGLQKEDAICKSHGISFINFPILDRCTPKTNDRVDDLISHLNEKINAGQSIVIHCRMRIGRSSIIAASILLKNGFNAIDAIDSISKTRGINVPDTEKQIVWLRSRQEKS